MYDEDDENLYIEIGQRDDDEKSTDVNCEVEKHILSKTTKKLFMTYLRSFECDEYGNELDCDPKTMSLDAKN